MQNMPSMMVAGGLQHCQAVTRCIICLESREVPRGTFKSCNAFTYRNRPLCSYIFLCMYK